MIVEIIFWLLLFILVYTYVGYAFILFLLNTFRRVFRTSKLGKMDNGYEPDVCLFVTAYNEKDYVEQKVRNSFDLDYPKEKVQYLWITDGSDDGTPELLKNYKELEVHHSPARRGKMHAMNRGMKFVKAPIVIFSDTNTRLNKNAVREIVSRFSNRKVGCVAGEKRIVEHDADAAAAAGEGLYWKYESWIKRMDAELNSAVGAVGELFAVRTELFEDVETDTILDDFIISLRIAQKGYKIDYTPNAFAEETASLNVKEELKRKIRITAGGIQTMLRMKSLFNPFKFGILSWQYFSHKVLRWTAAPISLFLVFLLNFFIVWKNSGFTNIYSIYTMLFYIQSVCYFLGLIGWFFENQKLRFKVIFIPYYFIAINYASVRGVFRYFRGKQSVNWEKSKRA